jgi:hypothetical protein
MALRSKVKRGDNSKFIKKFIYLSLGILLVLGALYITNYTPNQTIEIGEYKNYKIK